MLPRYLLFLHLGFVLFSKCCSDLSLFIIRSLGSKTSGICLKHSVELGFLVSLIILSAYFMSVSDLVILRDYAVVMFLKMVSNIWFHGQLYIRMVLAVVLARQ